MMGFWFSAMGGIFSLSDAVEIHPYYTGVFWWSHTEKKDVQSVTYNSTLFKDWCHIINGVEMSS